MLRTPRLALDDEEEEDGSHRGAAEAPWTPASTGSGLKEEQMEEEEMGAPTGQRAPLPSLPAAMAAELGRLLASPLLAAFVEHARYWRTTGAATPRAEPVSQTAFQSNCNGAHDFLVPLRYWLPVWTADPQLPQQQPQSGAAGPAAANSSTLALPFNDRPTLAEAIRRHARPLLDAWSRAWGSNKNGVQAMFGFVAGKGLFLELPQPTQEKLLLGARPAAIWDRSGCEEEGDKGVLVAEAAIQEERVGTVEQAAPPKQERGGGAGGRPTRQRRAPAPYGMATAAAAGGERKRRWVAFGSPGDPSMRVRLRRAPADAVARAFRSKMPPPPPQPGPRATAATQPDPHVPSIPALAFVDQLLPPPVPGMETPAQAAEACARLDTWCREHEAALQGIVASLEKGE